MTLIRTPAALAAALLMATSAFAQTPPPAPPAPDGRPPVEGPAVRPPPPAAADGPSVRPPPAGAADAPSVRPPLPAAEGARQRPPPPAAADAPDVRPPPPERADSRRLHPPHGPRAGDDARRARETVVSGRVARWLVNPRGEVDGLLLVDGTQVAVPPHLSKLVVAAVKVNDAVDITGRRGENARVVRASMITDKASGRSVGGEPRSGPRAAAATPPRTGSGTELLAMNASGRIDTLLYTGRGDVNGALLQDGTIVRIPPHAAAQMADNLKPGAVFYARGYGTRGEQGNALEATAIGTDAATASDIAGPARPGPRPGPEGAGPRPGPDCGPPRPGADGGPPRPGPDAAGPRPLLPGGPGPRPGPDGAAPLPPPVLTGAPADPARPAAPPQPVPMAPKAP